MEFLNAPVRVEELPRAEEMNLLPVERTYWLVLRWGWAITMLVLVAMATALIVLVPELQNTNAIAMAGGGLLLIAVTWFFLQKKSFERKAYAIRDKDVIYRTGWVFQKIYTCPFNRIQNTTVTTGPFQRRYGLATLILYTAGANDADVHIPGLKEETARTLKEWITKKIADEPASGL